MSVKTNTLKVGENPPDYCECAGCSMAAERHRRGEL
jgi:hypothetical protein